MTKSNMIIKLILTVAPQEGVTNLTYGDHWHGLHLMVLFKQVEQHQFGIQIHDKDKYDHTHRDGGTGGGGEPDKVVLWEPWLAGPWVPLQAGRATSVGI